MSKSVRDYTELTARINSTEGTNIVEPARQNSRLRFTGLLCLVCIGLLLFVFNTNAFAQPPDPDLWWAWNPAGADDPFVDDPQPNALLWVDNDGNIAGWYRYTAQSLINIPGVRNYSLTGTVAGTNASGSGTSGSWWIGNASAATPGALATVLNVDGGRIHRLYELTVQGSASVTDGGVIENNTEVLIMGNLTNRGRVSGNVPSGATFGIGTLQVVGDTFNYGTISNFADAVIGGNLQIGIGMEGGDGASAGIISNIGNASSLYLGGTTYRSTGLHVGGDMTVGVASSTAGAGSAGTVNNVTLIKVEGNLINNHIIENFYSTGRGFMSLGEINVRGHIQNGSLWDIRQGEGEVSRITNFDIVDSSFLGGIGMGPGATSLQNVGIIEWNLSYGNGFYQNTIIVDGHLENGIGIANVTVVGNALYRERRQASILGSMTGANSVGGTVTSAPELVISAGSLSNRADGEIIAFGGTISVQNELINEGIIETALTGDTVTSLGYWAIDAGSIFNDGRLAEQGTEFYTRDTMTDGRWGQIYDATIYTDGDLVNQGAKAVIDGMVNTTLAKWMHIGGRSLLPLDERTTNVDGPSVGNLLNLDGALITGYGQIVVHGGFLNRGATLVGGHWNGHVSEHPMDIQTGLISVWENFHNTSESRLDDIYGGLITSFDTFHVHGSAYNDAYSTITGTLFIPGAPIWGPDPTYTGTPPAPIIIIGYEADQVIEGRRANVLGGVMYQGTYQDARSILNVEGLVNINRDTVGAPAFYGLYNEGYIGDIDIITVGSNESGILWNAYPATAPVAGAQRADGVLIRTLDRHYGHIYNVGIINATNLYNSGTLSEIDVEIRVSYGLFNAEYGIIDGLSTFHTEWDYSTIIDNPRLDNPEDGFPVMVRVEEDMRADLIVGKMNADNPLLPYLAAELIKDGMTKAETDAINNRLNDRGAGIVNIGTITNFDIITSTGDMYNFGSVGTEVQTNSGLMGGVTTLNVGANTNETTRADLYNYGTLANIGSITVTRDIVLGEGAAFENVGSVAAHRHITIEDGADIDGGFKVLGTGTGRLLVGTDNSNPWEINPVGGLITDPETGYPILREGTARLKIDGGAVASATTEIRNFGHIINNGLLSSSTSIFNRGIIENNGMVNAFSDITNRGLFTGNGMVNVGGNFVNDNEGIVSGSLTISGNFQNAGGRVVLTDTKDMLRAVDGGEISIVGGSIDQKYVNPIVGTQYMFMAAEEPGKLHVTTELRGFNSNTPGTVLDFVPAFGRRGDDGRYIEGTIWNRTNQYYWLEFQRAYSYGANGRTPNQIAIGKYIDTIGQAPVTDGGLWKLLQQLDGISDGYGSGTVGTNGNVLRDNPHYSMAYAAHQGEINPAALQALNELSGTIYANIGIASAHNVGVVNRSLADALRSDVFQFSFIGNPNNAIRGQAIAPLRYTRWGTLFGIGGSTSSDGNSSGYNQSFGGILAGIDRALWTGTRVGGWFSAATGDITMKGVHESTDVTSVMAGMYMRQEMYYGYGLVSAGFGVDDYKTKRRMTHVGYGNSYSAESKNDGTIGTLYMERGIDIPVYYATVQPYTSFQVVCVEQDKFREKMWDNTGQYTTVGLEGVKGRTESYQMSIGARMSSTPYAMKWGQMALTTNMAWFHDFNADKNREFVGRFGNPGGLNFGSDYSNTTFKISGNNPKRDWLNFGFGLHLDRNSTRVFLGADLFANDRQTLFSGYGGWGTSW